MIGTLDAKIPPGPLAQKWRSHRDHMRLVNPNNRRKFEIIVVGSGLAGGSAAATLGELGYRVKCFCFQDSPRRAHSIAAQGGINAAKNYQNDGDSVYRLFHDTIKGGDFRSREANVYRLAEDQPTTSSINAWRKACPLRANTAAISPTVRLVARRCHGRFTRAVRPASNFCSVVIRRSAVKSPPAQCGCSRRRRCSIW